MAEQRPHKHFFGRRHPLAGTFSNVRKRLVTTGVSFRDFAIADTALFRNLSVSTWSKQVPLLHPFTNGKIPMGGSET